MSNYTKTDVDPCEQCMFGYKSFEERNRLLNNILENNRYANRN